MSELSLTSLRLFRFVFILPFAFRSLGASVRRRLSSANLPSVRQTINKNFTFPRPVSLCMSIAMTHCRHTHTHSHKCLVKRKGRRNEKLEKGKPHHLRPHIERYRKRIRLYMKYWIYVIRPSHIFTKYLQISLIYTNITHVPQQRAHANEYKMPFAMCMENGMKANVIYLNALPPPFWKRRRTTYLTHQRTIEILMYNFMCVPIVH